ncbi:radical SAM protein [Clostridium botulinum]|uniref:Radical SAM protein n=1 Tax=Clostridium botulinum TaxID=1491 RepID=A0A6M0SRS3_CLOBO|nr:radical SAM protein [Clostridium botulinum]
MKKILLISANTEKGPILYPIGLGYIHSGLIQKNYDAGILDLAHNEYSKECIFNYLREYNPDYIGISIRNLDNCCYRHPLSFANQIKQLVDWIGEWRSQTVIFIGGSAFSLLPESWLKFLNVNYGIIGDGTNSIPALVENLEKGIVFPKIPGLAYFKNERCIKYQADSGNSFRNINPSRDGFIHKLISGEKVRHNILSKRGCNYKCIFCAYHVLEGNKIIEREPQSVIDEIIEMIEKHNIYEFDFVDSVFNNPQKHAEEICRLIIENGLKVSWKCFLNPYNCSKDFLSLLKQAGCKHVELGIDTASDKMIRLMKKGFKKQDVCECIKNCNAVGLAYDVCLLFGCPGETIETVKETLELMDKLNVNELFGLIGIRILPHTEIFNTFTKGFNEDDLLLPKFYMSPEVEPKDIINVFNEKFKNNHPNWMIV